MRNSWAQNPGNTLLVGDVMGGSISISPLLATRKNGGKWGNMGKTGENGTAKFSKVSIAFSSPPSPCPLFLFLHTHHSPHVFPIPPRFPPFSAIFADVAPFPLFPPFSGNLTGNSRCHLGRDILGLERGMSATACLPWFNQCPAFEACMLQSGGHEVESERVFVNRTAASGREPTSPTRAGFGALLDNTVPNPFVNEYPWTLYAMLKAVLCFLVLVPIRLVVLLFACLVLIAVFLPLVNLMAWLLRTGHEEAGQLPVIVEMLFAPLRLALRMVLWSFGFWWIPVTDHRKEKTQRPKILVANHCSIMDVVFMCYYFNFPCAVAKSDIATWPVIGSFCRCSGGVLRRFTT